MATNAAMLRAMRDEGLDLDACIRIIEAGEKNDPTGAARQARFRGKNSNGVTSRVTPPKEEIKTPLSVPDGTGASADPVKDLFDLGIGILKSQGKTEKEARSLVGSWRKGRSDGDVAAALLEARTRSISNLVEWMPKRLNATGPPKPFFKTIGAEQRTGTNG